MKRNDITPPAGQTNQFYISDFDIPDASTWKQAAIQGLKGAPFEKVLQRTNLDNILLDAIYCQNDFDSGDTVNELCRGRAESRLWDIGQILQCRDTRHFRDLTAQALSVGQTEVRFVFAPVVTDGTKANMLAPMDEGIAVASLKDFSKAFSASPPQFPVRFQSGDAGLAALALWAALHRQREWQISDWRGSLGFAPVSTLALRGRIGGTLPRIFDECHRVVDWMRQHAPNANALLVDGSCYHNGGASAALEVACCLAESAIYIRQLVSRGISPDVAANAISIQMATGDDFFEDIAKMRSIRLLYAGVAKALGAQTLPMVELWTRTSTLFATQDEPLNNVLRAISATMSGALGGACSIHAAPFNESFAKTDAFAARIARNIQLVLQQECRIGEVADPCGGAYYVEHLTDRLAEAAWKLFGEFEASSDGYLGALQSGQVASMVAEQFAMRMRQLNKRKFKMVGVNDFVAFDKADEALRSGCKHDAPASLSARTIIDGEAFSEDDDWMLAAADALLAGKGFAQVYRATKGDKAATAPQVSPRCLSEGYENLRKAVAKITAKRTTPCSVLLLRIGTVRETKARTDFSRGFFNAAGFEIAESPLCETVAEACRAAKSGHADVTVICSTDERYLEMAAEVAVAIQEKCKTQLVLAGRPGDNEAMYRKSGIDAFIYLGADHYKLLKGFVEAIGASHG